MPHVELRPLESEDVAGIASWLAHPSLVGRRQLDDDKPVRRSRAALVAALEPLVDPDDGEAWVVDSDGAVGLVMVDWWWDALTPWAHVVIDPERQRQGHGAAAARLTMGHLFSDTPAVLIQYGVPSWDDAGLAFAATLGGVDVGRKRRVGVRDGAYYDHVEFVISRDTWEERHGA